MRRVVVFRMANVVSRMSYHAKKRAARERSEEQVEESEPPRKNPLPW